MATASFKRIGVVDTVFDDVMYIGPCGNCEGVQFTDLVQCSRDNFQPTTILPERSDLRVYLRTGDQVHFTEQPQSKNRAAEGIDQQHQKTANFASLLSPRIEQRNDRYFGIIDQIANGRGELCEAWLPSFEGRRVMLTAESVAHLLPQTAEAEKLRATQDVVPILYKLNLWIGARITCKVDGDIGGRFIAVDVEPMVSADEATYIGSIMSATEEIDDAYVSAKKEKWQMEGENDKAERLPSLLQSAANRDAHSESDDVDLKATTKKKSDDELAAANFHDGIICTVQRNFGFIWSAPHGRVFFHRENLIGSVLNSDLYNVRMDEMFHPLQCVKYRLRREQEGDRGREKYTVTFIEPSQGFCEWESLRVASGQARMIRGEAVAMLGSGEYGDFVELHRNALPMYSLNIRDAIQIGEHYNVLLASKVDTNPRFRGGSRRVWYALTVLPDDVKNTNDLLQRVKVDLQEDQQATVMNACIFYCGNLASGTCAQQLKDYFKRYGKVVYVRIIRDWKTKASRKFGFVGFDSHESAAREKVLREGPHFIDGNQIIVGPARSQS